MLMFFDVKGVNTRTRNFASLSENGLIAERMARSKGHQSITGPYFSFSRRSTLLPFRFSDGSIIIIPVIIQD